MQEAHPLAGKTVKLKVKGTATDFKTGDLFRLEDWWVNVGEKSWMMCAGNPACMMYILRVGQVGLPVDNNVVYGKVGMFGHLIHVSELGEVVEAHS